MKNLFLLIMFSNVLLAFNASSQDGNEVGQSVNESKYLSLKPLPKPKLDFELILKKNRERNLDIYDVYAWSMVYENQFTKSAAMVNYIKNKMSPEELNKANSRFTQLSNNLKNNKIKKGIIPPNNLLFDRDKTDYDIIPIKTVPPKYPRMALIAKIQGYVNIEFNVYPDGSTRDIYISSEYPKRIFTKAAIQAITKYKFKTTLKGDNKQARDKQATTQKIDFRLQGNLPMITAEKVANVNRQFELAKNGNIKAQHFFTNAYNSLPIQFNHRMVKRKQINDWLFNSAIDGNADSQYNLGMVIYTGTGCLIEMQKGFEWMVIAANQDYAYAQYFLYNRIILKSIENTSGHTATYWLEKAAENGSLIAKLEFAKNTANSDKIDKKKLNQALGYIESYASSYGRLPQYYQIKALLLSKQGHKSKAKIAIKTAIKLAKRTGWDLTLLKQQHKMIRKS